MLCIVSPLPQVFHFCKTLCILSVPGAFYIAYDAGVLARWHSPQPPILPGSQRAVLGGRTAFSDQISEKLKIITRFIYCQ